MSQLFSDTLKKLRTEKGISQQALAEKMYVTRSTVARWESGSRLPDAVMISRISEVLGADVNMLLLAAAQSDECPNIIMVDDNEPHIALNNIRQRLDMMCNGKLDISRREGGGTLVKVTIPNV